MSGDAETRPITSIDEMEHLIEDLESEFFKDPTRDRLFQLVETRRNYLSMPGGTIKIPNRPLTTIKTKIDFGYVGSQITEEEAQYLLENNNGYEEKFGQLWKRRESDFQSKSL